MTTIKGFIKRHPVLTYFVLTFAISRGGTLMVIRESMKHLGKTPPRRRGLCAGWSS